MTTPVQGSWGGIVHFKHNFPRESGDVAEVGYRAPNGDTGRLPSTLFTDTEVSARIPEDLLDEKDLNWTFNVIVSGTRPAGPFLIQSKSITKVLYRGIGDYN